MTRTRARGIAGYFALSLALPVIFACSGGSTDPDPPGGGGGELEFASVVATPTSATISKGGSTSTTVVYAASPGITYTSFGIQRQYSGISVTQTSTQGSGTNVTRVYTIGADATVPTGTHIVTFSTGITGAKNTVNHTNAQFSLTVN